MALTVKRNDTGGSSSSVGFAGWLTLLFIALKLCKVVDWSWVWVLAPLWITIALAIITVFVVAFVNAWKGV